MSPNRPGRASQLRLSGGYWRGRRLRVGPGVRPTEGRVREALFSIWQDRLPGAAILDLFAGSGAVGLEAVGRGAERAVLVESSAKVLAILRENLAALKDGNDDSSSAIHLQKGLLPGWLQLEKKVLSVLRNQPFDLIFADPPYRFSEFPTLLLAAVEWLADDGQLVIEHSVRVELPTIDGVTRVDQRAYGESCLSFFEKSLQPSGVES